MSSHQSFIRVEEEVPQADLEFSRRRRSLAWGTKWAGGQIGWQFLTKIVRGLVLPKILSPALYGLYASLRVPLSYEHYTDLGVRYQLAKQLPQTLAREGATAFEDVAASGRTWILASTGFFCLVLLLLAMRVHGPDAWFYRPGFEILALTVLLAKLEDFFGIRANAREDFRQSGLAAIWRDTGNLVVSIALVLFLGPMGPVIGICAGEMLCVYYYWRRGSLRCLNFRLHGLTSLLRGGLLLFSIGLLDTAILTLDQFFVLGSQSKAQFGIYALGGFVAAILLSISGVFLVIQPRLMRLEAESKPAELDEVMEATLLLYLLLAALAVILSVPAISLIVLVYLPKYRLGIPIYALFSALAIVRGTGILLRPYFIARSQEKRLLAIEIAGVTAALLLNGLAWWLHAGLSGYCLASLATYAFTMALMLRGFERQRLTLFRRGKYAFALLGLAVVAAFYMDLRTNIRPGLLLADAVHLLLSTGTALAILLLSAWIYRGQLHAAYRLFMQEAA